MKWVVDIARAAPIRLLWLIAGWLPVRGATALGVFFGVAFGPLHPKHRKVVGNFRIALKSASDREVGAIARQSWRNAGAVFAELPHVREIAASRVEMDVAREVMVLVEARVPILFLAAHIANWEILPFVVSKLCGCATCVYTPEDNHYIARKVQSFREHPHCEFVTKGTRRREC